MAPALRLLPLLPVATVAVSFLRELVPQVSVLTQVPCAPGEQRVVQTGIEFERNVR
eukprot:CAMPEP_0171291536 /NCGR_PEP_ID=MMETSP0790-20130122/71702_1 /TAXON_ID=2925 /ORGANISM="Alexandrium catenella, Strain OF101" /LENGTH=55 /DNA_ID=CAMNT_0011761261 /DNA_START=39 /DNA_END=203 /DNA_ORIENTATION=+